MEVTPEAALKLSAQRALLGNVVPGLRAVSVDLDEDQKLISLRCVFDGEPEDAVKEVVSVIGTEMIADYSAQWQIQETIICQHLSKPIQHLPLLVYLRCEDDGVL